MRDAAHHGASPSMPRETGWLMPSIQRSHERSETYGLSASMRPDYDVLPNVELAPGRDTQLS